MAALDFTRTMRQEGLLILSKAAGSQGSCPPSRTESPPNYLSSNHQDYAESPGWVQAPYSPQNQN